MLDQGTIGKLLNYGPVIWESLSRKKRCRNTQKKKREKSMEGKIKMKHSQIWVDTNYCRAMWHKLENKKLLNWHGPTIVLLSLTIAFPAMESGRCEENQFCENIFKKSWTKLVQQESNSYAMVDGKLDVEGLHSTRFEQSPLHGNCF